MSAKFVAFINPRDRKPMLINPAQGEVDEHASVHATVH